MPTSSNVHSEVFRPLPLWSTVATGAVKSSTPIATMIFVGNAQCMQIWRISLCTSLQKNIVNKIFSNRSSFYLLPCASGHTCMHVYQQTHIASERRIGWSSKLLEIFEVVVLSWVYKQVGMKYSRGGGTKFWFHAGWQVEVKPSSNGCGDSICPLLLWPSSSLNRVLPHSVPSP
jgi:hypothetical protein